MPSAEQECPECGLRDGEHKMQCSTGRGYSSYPVPNHIARKMAELKGEAERRSEDHDEQDTDG